MAELESLNTGGMCGKQRAITYFLFKKYINLRFIYFLSGLAYASGLAATLNIVHLLKAGDTIVCTDDVYGGEPSQVPVFARS